MARAGNPPPSPEGWSNADVGSLRSTWDSATQGAALDSNGFYKPKSPSYYSGEYRPDLEDDAGNPISYASPQAPAPLIEVPTSSINASRPRTVAAGYDESRRVMTVMFRDGTLYNYYDVSESEWLTFHGSISKGRAGLNKYRNGVYSPGVFYLKAQGPADLTGVSPAVANQIYTIARNAQMRYVTNRNYATPNAHRSLESAQKMRKRGSTSVVGKRVAKGALKKAGFRK